MGCPLSTLRQRIANQDKIYSNLWELIVLYSCLPLGTVEHERVDEGRPDICIRSPGLESIWIEATYVYSRTKPHTDSAADLVKWLLLKLDAAGVSNARMANVEILLRDDSQPIEAPRQNEWSQLLRSAGWRQFVGNAKSSRCNGCAYSCPSGNMVVQLRGLSQTNTTSILFPSSKVLRDPTRHPIYKEVLDKASSPLKNSRSRGLGSQDIPNDRWEMESPS